MNTPEGQQGLQHLLNNARAARFAELQHLEMEELPAEPASRSVDSSKHPQGCAARPEPTYSIYRSSW